MVQIKLFILFILAATAIAFTVALPVPGKPTKKGTWAPDKRLWASDKNGPPKAKVPSNSPPQLLSKITAQLGQIKKYTTGKMKSLLVRKKENEQRRKNSNVSKCSMIIFDFVTDIRNTGRRATAHKWLILLTILSMSRSLWLNCF